MALEQAGVELIAKNFNKYIKQLDTIDKTQQEVFGPQLKGVDKSFGSATKAANKYEKELKQISQTSKQTAAAQSQLGAATKIVGVAIAAVVAQQTLRFAGESLNLAREQLRVEAQLGAAIKSTGGAAGLTKNELTGMAAALQQTTNFGDEATIGAQALLLTFTKIGRETFPQAIETILDMSSALGTDLNSATIQVGKALNDPIAGVTALTRSGVQFTEQQKEQIRTLTESGRVLEAQRVILAELETQFGGSAEAARKADGGIIALSNSFGDFQEEVGRVILILNSSVDATGNAGGALGVLSRAAITAQKVFALAGAGFAATVSIISQSFDLLVVKASQLGQDVLKALAGAAFNVASNVFGEPVAKAALFVGAKIGKNIGEGLQDADPGKTFQDVLDEAAQVAEDRFKDLASVISGVEFPGDEIEKTTQALDTSSEAVEENKEQFKALGQALKQAEDLSLSFARAQEDVTRKATREVIKLEEKQAKDRDKLLKEQAKELDSFEKNRLKEIDSTEKDIAKERANAARNRVNEQRKLQQKLRQEQERFNLSQIQSERQFQLQETRLRAEGDILALQQLREDKNLQQLEEKENFDLSQRQAKEDGKEQQRIQADNLDERLRELKVELEDQRAELLAGFDNQLVELQNSQQEQRAELQRNLAEQEADRQLSQQRQLEDLGRSFAQQETITEEGATAIANELEGIFGIDGTASTIISGFTAQTESEFTALFEKLEEIVSQADLAIPESIVPAITGESRRGRGSRGRGRFTVPGFQEGGTVPGPIGQPQLAVVHGGETVIPAQQTISAPVIPSQNLNVEMSGGFNITGGEQAGQAVVEASISEMTDALEIAVKRLIRRGAANG